MSRLSIGVALAIPEPWGTQLHDLREQLGDADAKAIPPHITLLPPTALPAVGLDAVVEHLTFVASQGSPFRVRLEGVGTFRPVSPVVFVQLRQGMAESALLERLVRSGPLERDVTFSYYPHVTVAHELSEPELDAAELALEGYSADFEVPGFSLFERAADGWWRPMQEFAFPRKG